MSLMKYKLQFIAALASSLVTLFTISTLAKTAASPEKASGSTREPSLQSIGRFAKDTQRLTSELSGEQDNLSLEEVQGKIRELESLSEAYFKSAGIQFEKNVRVVAIKRPKTSEKYNVFYAVFYLAGSSEGDEISRLLNGVRVKSRIEKTSIKFEYDPLYQINHPGSNGHFEFNVRTIVIGPHVLVGEIFNYLTTLRHEIKHYFEELKVISGKMTLARVTFSEPQAKARIAYEDYLSMDELETHLLDLRTLINAKKSNSKSSEVIEEIGNSTFQSIIAARKYMIEYKTMLLKIIIQNSKEATENLVKSMHNSSVEQNADTGAIEVFYSGMKQPYSYARVTLRGLLPAGFLTNKVQINAEVSKVLKWQQERISQIEAEFEKLQQVQP